MYNDRMSIEDLNFYPVDSNIKKNILDRIDSYDENRKSDVILIVIGTVIFLGIVDIALKNSEAAIWIIGCILICIIATRAFFVNNMSTHAKIKYIKESLNNSQFQIASALAYKLELMKSTVTDTNDGQVLGYNYELCCTLKNFDGRIINKAVSCVLDDNFRKYDEKIKYEYEEGEKIFVIRYKHKDEYFYYGIKEDSEEYFQNNLKAIIECSSYEGFDKKA